MTSSSAITNTIVNCTVIERLSSISFPFSPATRWRCGALSDAPCWKAAHRKCAPPPFHQTLNSYALQRLGDERAALFAIVDAGRQQRDIFLDVGRLGLVAGREPRRACVLRQTRAEGPHLD